MIHIADPTPKKGPPPKDGKKYLCECEIKSRFADFVVWNGEHDTWDGAGGILNEHEILSHIGPI